ncbi:AAA family ATPase [Streptomyces sp. NPDC058469]|uniref:AAA family ATPase n=1 Tax=Streptomyces sp. NPDC058469 TaxID=3346514 RepID=UPI00364A562A
MGEKPLLHPEIDDLRTAWTATLDSARGEPLIVHVAGHGLPAPGGDDRTSLYVPVYRSDARQLPRTAIALHRWLEDVEHTPDAAPTLFLIDACGSGRAALHQLTQRLNDANRQAWVIAACTPHEKAYAARFTTAVARVLRQLRKGRLDVGPAFSHIPLEVIAAEIDRELALLVEQDGAAYDQTVLMTPRLEARPALAPFFPNPAYQASPAGRFRGRVDAALWAFAAEADPMLDPVHFLSRASGTRLGQIAHGCLFTGRKSQRRRLTAWLDDPQGDEPSLFVVTGSPGAGKSALLGVEVCLTHPQLRDVAGTVRTRIDVRQRPLLNPLLAAVHARQRTGQQVLDSLARQLSLHLPEASPGSWTVQSIETQLRRLNKPAVLVLDALDEATEPEDLLAQVLLPLASARVTEKDGRERALCRVLIGTRPWWDRFSALKDALSHPDDLLDLDLVPDRELRTDLTDYLEELLWSAPAYQTDAEARRQVCVTAATELIGRRQDGGFLLASLFADYLERRPDALNPGEIVDLIPRDLPGMMELHLSVLTADEPWLRPVLVAVAHAYGDGMPLRLVHEAALGLLDRADAPRDPSTEPALEDTRHMLETASFYLRTATESDGRQLYRFFHASLSEYLRKHPVGGGVRDATGDTQEHVFRRLVEHVPGSAGARRWRSALPYLRRHAIDHAPAGAVDGLLEDAEFVVHADVEYVTAHLHRAEGTVGRAHAAVYRSAIAHTPGLTDPEARRQLLALDAIRWGVRPLLTALEALRPRTGNTAAAVTVRWATNSALQPALRHTLPVTDRFSAADLRPFPMRGHTYLFHPESRGKVDVWDLTSGRLHTSLHPGDQAKILTEPIPLPNGRTVVLTAGAPYDSTVRMWDLEDGSLCRSLGSPGQKTQPEVRVVALEGRAHAAVLYPGTRTVRIWELESGTQRDCIEHDIEVSFAHVVPVDGRPHLLTGSRPGDLFVWDLADASLRCRIECSQASEYYDVTDGGRSVMVEVGAGTEVSLWDLSDGTRYRSVNTGVFSHETDLLEGGGLDAPLLFVWTGRDSGDVWDLGSGERVDTLSHSRNAPPYVVAGEAGPLLLTSGDVMSGTIRVYSLRGRRHRYALPSRRWRQMRPFDHDGTALALTVGDEGQEMVLWDLDRGVERHRMAHGAGTAIEAVGEIDGVPHAVTSSKADGTLRVWNVSDGRLRQTLHQGVLHEAAFAEIDGHTHVLTTKLQGALRVWDVSDGSLRPKAIARTWTDVALVEEERCPAALVVTETSGKGDATGTSTVEFWDLSDGTLQWKRPFGYGASIVEVVSVAGEPHVVAMRHHLHQAELGVWPLHDPTALRVFEPPLSTEADVHVVDLDGVPFVLSFVGVVPRRKLVMWEIGTSRVHAEMHHPGLLVELLVAETPQGPIGLISSAETVQVWDLRQGALLHTLVHQGTGRVEPTVVITPAGPRLLTVNKGAENRDVMVWELTTGSLLARLTHAHELQICPVTPSCSPFVLTVCPKTAEVQVWTTEGEAGPVVLHHGKGPTAVDVATFPLDGRPHAVTSTPRREGPLSLWDLASGSLRCTTERSFTGPVTSLLADTGPGPMVLSCDRNDPSVTVWDPRTGETVGRLGHGAQRGVKVVTTMHDGRHFALTFGGGTSWVRLWDLTDLDLRRQPVTQRFPAPVQAVSVADSGYLVQFGSEAAFTLWPAPEGDITTTTRQETTA